MINFHIIQLIISFYVYLEHGVEGADAHVADGEEADDLYPPVVLVVSRGLDEDGEQ